MSAKLSLDQDIAVRAFEAGFHAGADPMGSRKRTVVEPATHQHWRKGHGCGRAALAAAVSAFKQGLLTCRCGHKQREHEGDPVGVGPCLNVSGDLCDSSGVSACSCRLFKAGNQGVAS